MGLEKFFKSLIGRSGSGENVQFAQATSSVQAVAHPVNPSAAPTASELLQSAVDSHKQGDLDGAEALYLDLLQIEARNADALQYLGMLNGQRGQHSKAAEYFQQALAISPQHFAALSNFGNTLMALGCHEAALEQFERALALRPENAQLWFSQGNALLRLGRAADACASYRRALDVTPDFAEAHCALGNVLGDLGESESAAASCRKALEIRPGFAEAHCVLGKALSQSGRYDEGIASYRRALEIKPDFVEAAWNLSIALRDTGQLDEAVASCRRVLHMQPDFVEATWNLSLMLLAQGNYAEAWPLHESRYDPRQQKAIVKAGNVPLPEIPFPQWRGEPLAGKSVLLLPEQGSGDYIQFIRYAKLLKERGVSRLTVLCAPALCALLETAEGVDAIATGMESVPLHDFWCFPLSLPMHVGTTQDTIPAGLPYLAVSPGRVERWRATLPAAGLKVGLVWKGNALHANDCHRSLPGLAALAPLWKIPGLTFVSLQKGQGEEEAAQAPADQPIVALGPDIVDFADTAAIVSQLDLVVCVDTAIAHVAGALNKPCWVLLPAINTDWRWLQHRTDSPWYPGSMRLFRQAQRGDWAGTVNDVAQALRQRVSIG